jgi:hypothetical protein
MTKPIHLKPAEVRRLERNLSGKQGKPREDPADTIRRLRAEIAELHRVMCPECLKKAGIK